MLEKNEKPTAARCGELLCQRDSYARSTCTVVLSCTMAAPVNPAKSKKKASPVVAQLWEVVLKDTVRLAAQM